MGSVGRYPKLFRGADSVSVDVGSVDELFANRYFDLLKIDVEGAELAMLEGAAGLLQSNPPGLIYIEVYPDFLDQVHARLKPSHEFGYRVVCDARGYGRLYDLEFDVSKLDPEQYFTVPPSYLFSSRPLDAYSESWTAPLAMPA